MNSKPQTAPDHMAIMNALNELKGEMKGRFTGIDKEIKGLREQIADLHEKHGELIEGKSILEMPVSTEDGLPFKSGWARKLAISALGVTFVGGGISVVENVGKAVVAVSHEIVRITDLLSVPIAHP